MAAANGHVEAVRLLLRHNAVSAEPGWALTAYVAAALMATVWPSSRAARRQAPKLGCLQPAGDRLEARQSVCNATLVQRSIP